MRFKVKAADLEFKNQMESCEFPASDFNHRAHIRLAYIYLSENGTDKSTELMRNTLNRFLIHYGVDPSKYHATLTKAWILAVHHFMNKAGDSKSADEFIDRNPEMLDTKIMMTHYSAEVLFSDEARTAFIEPDLDPIPRYGE
ncbi:hypothetical protein ACFL1S_00830 [Pseudomonadota bacterium]